MAVASEKSIFFDALEFESTAKRAAYVEHACGGDVQLLTAVRALLRENDREENPVDNPVGAAMMPTALPAGDGRAGATRFAPGTLVGPYKLMERIGEGGFGLVFVAQQQAPVRRRVALKIIKPGMESREVLARFEAERQAIALMDHPNIARVFEAGVTETAQPYFVMELVRGVPLIEFCDHHQLNMSERLELFVTICHAVQHAHQKGIIHRDLKPSNILVTLQDGRPLAKVIDFGVAKAIGQSLTVKTIYTRFASMVGTPAYMSPEQAAMSTDDIDTRSDIYSLGVLLYEVLTGATPFAPDRLQSAGFDELRRIIREEDPPRPSTRLSTLNNELASTIAVNRRLDPATLSSAMKRDLDWIVMKAMDKDRNRRYSTAGAMAEDVSRFLSDQPVDARPPSTLYRFSKFARRNKVVISTASLVACALMLGTAVSVWQAHAAIQERDEKEVALEEARAAEQVANAARLELERFNDRLNSTTVLLASGRANADAQRWPEAYQAYTKATDVLPKYFLVWLERGGLNAKLGRWNAAAADYAQAVEIGCPIEQAELSGVPQLLFFAGETAAYEKLCEELRRFGKNDPMAVMVRGQLAGETTAPAAAELADRVERMLAAIRRPDDSDVTHESDRRRRKYAEMFYGVNLYVAGWAHLRAGNHQRALQRLEESNQANWLGRGIADPLLAIAHHRTGNAEGAVRSFEQSQALLDRLLDESVSQAKGVPSIPWIDWIEFLLHHREASIVVKGHTPANDPRLRQMERFADERVSG
ncbi:Serine/threonine-protein kinase PknB [Stieleria neptunia]|uniref:Serine/threonine-protein kinase PknB n=1 Tax=Stieleria neptunia TaxID=2527979 RepID=A0A518HNF4_9BACT|nr:serine/threonine-protein kinase [Stieleria neptunia]QDV42394.1 Serine/threonine-protein kinase PknB [Stieleria neptunia]